MADLDSFETGEIPDREDSGTSSRAEVAHAAFEYVRMAESLLAEGEDERALELLRQAAYLDPTNIELQFKYIYALIDARKYELADQISFDRAALNHPLPTYFHVMWIRIPFYTLDWGLAIERADQLLEKFSIEEHVQFSTRFLFEKCVALRECARFGEARVLLEAHWKRFAEAFLDCTVDRVLYDLQIAGLHEIALRYLDCVSRRCNRAELHGVKFGNAIMSVRRAIYNSRWVNKHAFDVKILSLSQNCLPYLLSRRLGLYNINTENTVFDMSSFHLNTVAELLETDFEPLKDRKQFDIQLLPGGIPMMRHKSGVVFAHERGHYSIGPDRERFHRELQKLIAAFRRESSVGARLFIYSLVGAGDPNKIVESLVPRLNERNVRLLILDFKNLPTSVIPHPKVTYRHVPYPENYVWSLVDQYTSDRGYEFESAVTEVIRTEMDLVQLQSKITFTSKMSRIKNKWRGKLRQSFDGFKFSTDL